MFSRKTKQPRQPEEQQKSPVFGGDYIVFDIETSGLRPEQHKIIEIGAIKITNGQIVDSYHSLINYRGRLSSEVTQLTGIDPRELWDAPDRKTVLSEFFEFVSDYDLVGHNIIQFDNKFLWFGALSVGLTPIKNRLIDTLMISKDTFAADSYKLEYLCRMFGISIGNTHRAIDDANLTLKLFNAINERFPVQPRPQSVEYESTSQYGQRMDARYAVRNGNTDIEGLAGKKFCVTTFQPFHSFKTQRDLQQLIVDAGGEISNSVTRKVDYLIDCDPVYSSSKEARALEYAQQGKSNIKIISPDEFLALSGL